MLKGTLGLRLDGEEQVLEAGDSIYFDASRPHAYRRIGARACEAVVVTA